MDERFGELVARVRAGMERLGVPGAVVGVWHRGERRVAGLGVTSLENPLPVTPGTLFQIGSITKALTAVALMRLAEAGRLDLDRPLRDLLPGFAMADPEVTARATPRHLLTHTGGWVGDFFGDFGTGDGALAAMAAAIGRLPQVTPLGALFSYSNSGYNLAGRLLEVLAGQPYETAVRNLALAPLGLDDAWFYPEDGLLTRRFVAGHLRTGNRTEVARPWSVGRAGNCVGGCACTMDNLLDLARPFLDRGRGARGGQVLRPATVDAMLAPGVATGVGRWMGITWFVRDAGGIRICGHDGSTHGHEAMLHFAPEADFAAALLANCSSGSGLTGALLGWALDLWFDARVQAPALEPAAPGGLEACAGRYELPQQAFALRAEGDDLVLQDIPKGGFPHPGVPPGEPDPPARARLCAGDRFQVLEGPMQGGVGEFFRGADGKVAFCRFRGRVHPRAN